MQFVAARGAPLSGDELSALFAAVGDAQWHEWRRYVAACRALSCGVTEAVAEVVQRDFIALRQQNKEVREDILHYFLTLARLLGVSHLETTLSAERWAQMRALDAQRGRQTAPTAAARSQ